jgi:hypothetical protein
LFGNIKVINSFLVLCESVGGSEVTAKMIREDIGGRIGFASLI